MLVWVRIQKVKTARRKQNYSFLVSFSKKLPPKSFKSKQISGWNCMLSSWLRWTNQETCNLARPRVNLLDLLPLPRLVLQGCRESQEVKCERSRTVWTIQKTTTVIIKFDTKCAGSFFWVASQICALNIVAEVLNEPWTM